MKLNYIIMTLFLVITINIFAQIPEKINYQGLVTDIDGNAIADGKHKFDFNLYTQNTGGTSIWSETRILDVKFGVVNVVLGETNPINIDFSNPLFLGISIDDALELKPRVEFTSVPFALRAKTVEKDAIGSFNIADNSIVPRKINVDGAKQGQILKFNGDTLAWSEDLTGSGGGSGFSLPYKKTVNFPDNAFWIIHKGAGSVAKFDIDNIGAGGHSLEATSNGQTATIFTKNDNLLQNGANAIYGLSSGVASTSRFVNSGPGIAGEFENTKSGMAALFKKEGIINGEPVVKILDKGPYEHTLSIIDSGSGGSTVKILQADDINLKPTLEVEGGHLKYSHLASFTETSNGSGLFVSIDDEANKWQGQQIIHNGKGLGLYIRTKSIEENLETKVKEASLVVETNTESNSPISYLFNTNENFMGEGILLEHSGMNNAVRINKSNLGSALLINNSSTSTAAIVSQNSDDETAIYAEAKPDGQNATIWAKSTTFGAAIRGEGSIYGGFFTNTTNSSNGAAIYARSDGLNNNAIFIPKGNVVIDTGDVYINNGYLNIDANQYGYNIQIGGQIIAQGTITGASLSALSGGITVNGASSIDGDLWVGGTLSKAGGSFKIDHPLDPKNKYLYHSFVESPDMKNIYDGVVTLDNNGSAIVKLPDWFEALNKDFRYQLTCIGGFANVYISKEILNNKFVISGGRPGLKISWQVTGIRKDPWANKHRIPVEMDKPVNEKGKYLFPELYQQSK